MGERKKKNQFGMLGCVVVGIASGISRKYHPPSQVVAGNQKANDSF
jgi:hypothetical protein